MCTAMCFKSIWEDYSIWPKLFSKIIIDAKKFECSTSKDRMVTTFANFSFAPPFPNVDVAGQKYVSEKYIPIENFFFFKNSHAIYQPKENLMLINKN